MGKVVLHIDLEGYYVGELVEIIEYIEYPQKFELATGKGLKEPCSPYRTFKVFGEELGLTFGELWNCMPRIITPTTNYDLSTITENHEVVVAHLSIEKGRPGDYTLFFKWYRDRDNTLLFNYVHNWTAETGFNAGFASWIGWVKREITENGNYHLDVELFGPSFFSQTIPFTITGIPEAPPEPEPAGDFMAAIVSAFNFASALFYHLYVETYTWVFPFNLLSLWFYNLSIALDRLAWNTSGFFTWLNFKVAQIKDSLSWSTIWSYILSYIPNLEAIRDWFYNWWVWIDQRVNDWWTSTRWIVLGWVNEAKQYAKLWIDNLQSQVSSITTVWNNFVAVTLPSLPNWLDIEALIQSWTQSLTPFWEGWQELRDKVTDFIKDPEQWFYDRLDEIFERYW